MKNLLFLFLLLPVLALAQQPSSTDEEPAPPKKQSSSSWTWLIPTVLALGAGGYAWFVGEASKRRGKQLEGYIKQISKAQKKAATAPVVQSTIAPALKDDRTVQDLQRRVASLEADLEKLCEQRGRVSMVPPRQTTKNAAAPTASAQADGVRAQPTASSQPLAAAQPQATSSIMATVNKATAAPTPAGPQTKWAKYADAGDGFSTASLSDAQDGEKIFELTILDAVNARFRVVSAREPQQMALHDPNFFFAKVCTYDTLPTPQSTITTDTPGTLKLLGGKWTIQQPAKIRFS